MVRQSIGTAMASSYRIVCKAWDLKEIAMQRSVVQKEAARNCLPTYVTHTCERLGDLRSTVIEHTGTILEFMFPGRVRTNRNGQRIGKDYEGGEDEFDPPVQSTPRSLLPRLPTLVIEVSRFATFKMTVLSKQGPQGFSFQDFVPSRLQSGTADLSDAVARATHRARRLHQRALRLLGRLNNARKINSQRNISTGEVVFDFVHKSDASFFTHQTTQVQGTEPALVNQFCLIIKNSFIEFAEESPHPPRSHSWPHSLDRMKYLNVKDSGVPFTFTKDCLKPWTKSDTGNTAESITVIGAGNSASSNPQSIPLGAMHDDADGKIDGNADRSMNGIADHAIDRVAHRSVDCSSADSIVNAGVSWKRNTSSDLTDDSVSCNVDRRVPTTETRTTVILRNIPSNCSRAQLLEMLDAAGFAGRYNFAYLPIDFSHGLGLGYAFVNFLTPEDAVHVQRRFTGFKEWPSFSDCVCEVSWSHMRQGLTEHIKRYRNSPVLHSSVPDEYKPIFLVNGERVASPAPTTKVRPPRIRRNRG